MRGGMMRDPESPLVERPGLEDVAEEEDVFPAEDSGAPEPGSCQVCEGECAFEVFTGKFAG